MELFEEDREIVNCYFFCKIKEEGSMEFIGFNQEQLIITKNDLKSEKFEINQMYLFEKLEKKGKSFSFIKGKSFFSKNNGIAVTDSINYDNNIPYSLIGKIINKEKEQILLLLPTTNDIIIIINIGNQFLNIDENRYLNIINIRYSSKKDSLIYFEMNDFSKLELLNENYQDKKIKEKVAIKLNLLDYENNLKEEDILLKEFEIKSPKNYIVSCDSYKKIIYYVYDASDYNENEYYVQKIDLFFDDEFYPAQMKFFVYKSFLNQANLFVKQKCLNTYEFLYFSLDDSLPNEIEILSKSEKKCKYDNFHTFNSKIRKSIIFINIPPQKEEDCKYDNNFLQIFLCKDNKTEIYGTFFLKSVDYKKKKLYIKDSTIEKKLLDIYKDYFQYSSIKNGTNEFIKKYLSFNDEINNILESKIDEDLDGYLLEDNKTTLNYFNSLCFWGLLNIITKNKLAYSYVNKYITLYKKIVDKKDLNNIDKIEILITFTQITLEDKNNLECPEFFFYDELDEKNPYKVAFDFQYKIIDNINEKSCLFQPLLFLDSYIMDKIYNKEFKFIKSVKSAYSISMLTLDSIKTHLRESIKNYFFVIKKTNKLIKTNYNASICKFSKIVTYNENILLLENPKYNNVFEMNNSDLLFQSEFIKTYSLTLSLENMHENFSHGKETIINVRKSPTIYFDRNFKISYIYNHESQNYGEAGRLLEAFIGEQSIIEEIKKSIYDMSDYFDVKYFVDINFNKLIEGFKKSQDQNKRINETENIEYVTNNQINFFNYDKKNESKSLNKGQNGIKNDSKNEHIKFAKDDSLSNQEKKKDANNGDEDEIILSRNNTYIITADNDEELMKKIEQFNKKKIIVRKDAIKPVNKNFWY